MRERDVRYSFRKKLMIAGVVCFLLGFGTSLHGGNDGFVPIVRGGGGVTDHGALSGLLDNDHPQYGVTGHPHNQDLNSTDSPTFVQPIVTALTLSEYLVHGGDADTQLQFFTDNIIFTAGSVNMLEFVEDASDELVVNENSVDMDFRVESDGNTDMFVVDGGDNCVGIGTNPLANNQLCVYDAVNNLYVRLETDKTNGQTALMLYNDADNWRVMIDTDDRFKIYDGNTPFSITPGSTTNSIYIIPNQVNMFATSGTAGKELDLLGDAEFTTHVNSCSRLTKDIIFDLKELPDDKVLKLLRLIDFYIFRWKDPLLPKYDENGTLNGTLPWFTEGFGVGPVAEWLYDDILYNFTGNMELNQKVADAIVGRNSTLWTVDKDAIFILYARGWQITDQQLQENIMHTKHIENFLSGYGYNPLDWD